MAVQSDLHFVCIAAGDELSIFEFHSLDCPFDMSSTGIVVDFGTTCSDSTLHTTLVSDEAVLNPARRYSQEAFDQPQEVRALLGQTHLQKLPRLLDISDRLNQMSTSAFQGAPL